MIIDAHVHLPVQLLKLKKYLDKKQVVGIKLFTGHEAFYLTDERLKDVYELAIQYSVPVLFHSGWDNSQFSDTMLVSEVAKQYHELKLVCCHCFYPEIEKCLLLEEYPNVYFDISSIADNTTILAEIEMKIMKLIEKMPERVLFGSDYAGCSQKEHIHLVEKLGLKKEIEKRVYKENAERVYSLR